MPVLVLSGVVVFLHDYAQPGTGNSDSVLRFDGSLHLLQHQHIDAARNGLRHVARKHDHQEDDELSFGAIFGFSAHDDGLLTLFPQLLWQLQDTTDVQDTVNPVFAILGVLMFRVRVVLVRAIDTSLYFQGHVVLFFGI